MSGIYVHIPVCRRRCLYCAFYSVVDRHADSGALVDAILSEAALRREEVKSDPDTLYIGGGTPSLLPAQEFERLVKGLRDVLPLDNVSEFTIEVNPDDVTPDLVSVWHKSGVNRISMGVQSFDDSELSAIGRRHDSRTALEAYRLLRAVFDNISIDLMFGLPGQSCVSWSETVDKAMALRPEHISAYSLTFEERTALTRMRDRGEVTEAADDVSAEMFRILNEKISAAGYERYEISNYALPGRRSRHNSSYWRQSAYLGIGPSAHSYDGVRVRRANNADFDVWLRLFSRSMAVTDTTWFCEEHLSDEELLEEMVLTHIRTSDGIDLGSLGLRFGADIAAKIERRGRHCARLGLVMLTANSIVLTDAGVMVSDYVTVELLSF